MQTLIKEKYQKINILEKQKLIKLIKDNFEQQLAEELNLIRVSAPLVVTKESGLQDDLSGKERKVSFDLKDGKCLEIVQSLAKWKRYALKQYQIPLHHGLYTDMMAIRRDEVLDNTHSLYVDQWDWEKVITNDDRNFSYLKETVKKIVKAIIKTAKYLSEIGFKTNELEENVYFITTEELLKMYPNLTSKEREYQIVKDHKTVFIMEIGDILSNGVCHDERAPDYDDWHLNGDLFFYHEVLDMALEISSMGIRVNKESLLSELKKSHHEERLNYLYHQMIVNEELPLSIGGGIGQSRLCMLLLNRAHIGEVQSSYWDDKNIKYCLENEIELL